MDSSIKYQLEILKTEIEQLDSIIGRQDGITQAIKNWTIVGWVGAILFILGKDFYIATDLNSSHSLGLILPVSILITAIIPVMFWLLDSQWRSLQKRHIYRTKKISDFLNGDNLKESILKNKLIGIKVLDLAGREYRLDNDFKKFISLKRIMFFKEVRDFYLTLIILSFGIATLVFFINIGNTVTKKTADTSRKSFNTESQIMIDNLKEKNQKIIDLLVSYDSISKEENVKIDNIKQLIIDIKKNSIEMEKEIINAGSN